MNTTDPANTNTDMHHIAVQYPSNLEALKTVQASAPEEVAVVVECMKADSDTLNALVQSIIANRRLAWAIVEAWLAKNHHMLLPVRPQ